MLKPNTVHIHCLYEAGITDLTWCTPQHPWEPINKRPDLVLAKLLDPPARQLERGGMDEQEPPIRTWLGQIQDVGKA